MIPEEACHKKHQGTSYQNEAILAVRSRIVDQIQYIPPIKLACGEMICLQQQRRQQQLCRPLQLLFLYASMRDPLTHLGNNALCLCGIIFEAVFAIACSIAISLAICLRVCELYCTLLILCAFLACLYSSLPSTCLACRAHRR